MDNGMNQHSNGDAAWHREQREKSDLTQLKGAATWRDLIQDKLYQNEILIAALRKIAGMPCRYKEARAMSKVACDAMGKINGGNRA